MQVFFIVRNPDLSKKLISCLQQRFVDLFIEIFLMFCFGLNTCRIKFDNSKITAA
jgi:hypothetical protein